MQTAPIAPFPKISVILVAAGCYGALRKTMACLGEQTIHSSIEIVIVTLSAESFEVDANYRERFHSVRVEVCNGPEQLAAAAVTGVRQATAPFAAMIEDHCYPEPGWAEALLNRHCAGYDVVGAEIANANPWSAVSWCSYLLTLGAWAPPARAGEVSSVAAHNSSYRRDALLALGPELDELMLSETLLQWHIHERGGRIFLEPAAKAHHVNPSRLRTFLYVRFSGARLFAGIRGRAFHWPSRLFLAMIAPLSEIKRFAGVIGQARRCEMSPSILYLAPLFALGWFVATGGYIVGCLFGPGQSISFATRMYLDRKSTLSAADARRGLLSS
jgi:hypothetical protein